jgi:trans-aconitate methyltransferase
VHGIDASEEMIKKLRAKPGGDRIPVAIGDLADVAIDGRFSLIFVAFNTFFGLLSQEDQVRCFARVAEHLTANGVFVLEAFVPDVTRFDRGQRVGVTWAWTTCNSKHACTTRSPSGSARSTS